MEYKLQQIRIKRDESIERAAAKKALTAERNRITEENKIRALQEKIVLKDASVREVRAAKLKVIEEKKVESIQKREVKKAHLAQEKEARIQNQLVEYAKIREQEKVYEQKKKAKNDV